MLHCSCSFYMADSGIRKIELKMIDIPYNRRKIRAKRNPFFLSFGKRKKMWKGKFETFIFFLNWKETVEIIDIFLSFYFIIILLLINLSFFLVNYFFFSLPYININKCLWILKVDSSICSCFYFENNVAFKFNKNIWT